MYFTVPLSDSIKETIRERIGLDLSTVANIPMRWIKGDSLPHVDRSSQEFTTTHLVYLTDSAGEFVLGDTIYPISKNTAYVFNETLLHETRGATPRLLLGPMSEFGLPVGAPTFYYPSQADALAQTNQLAYGITYTVGDIYSGSIGGITHWRLAANSSGSSSQVPIYNNGNALNVGGTYFLYPAVVCFLEGSTILCLVDGKEQYIPIEMMRKGTLVKTSRDGYKAVVGIGYSKTPNPGNSERTEDRLYKYSKEAYPELTDDLFLTGCHSILVDHITEPQREKMTKILGKIFVTDKKYRLIACVDDCAEPWNAEGIYTTWHFALEHSDVKMNYGVYANGGLLVESCNIHTLTNKANMTLV